MKSAIAQIPNKIGDLLESHAVDLTEAWANVGEGSLDLSFSAKIGMKRGKNVCEVTISFSKEKVKDSVTFEWSDSQPHLFKVAK